MPTENTKPNARPWGAQRGQLSRAARVWRLAAAMAVTVAITACSKPPQVKSQHRQLIGSLRTAVSAQNVEWLEMNAKEVQKLRDAGEMGDEEFAAFDAIVQAAREGNWSGAESKVVSLGDAQQPTEEDLARLEARKVPAEHKEEHSRGK